MDNWQETLIQSLLGTHDEDSFFGELCRMAHNLGFENCAYGLRAPLPLSKPNVTMLNNYPASWQDQYAQQNYLEIDPTIKHGMRSITPIIWADSLFDKCRPFWEEAQAHGLRFGWAQSCHDKRGVASLLTVARPHNELSRNELSDLEPKLIWLTQFAHEGISALLAPKLIHELGVVLSSKEVEVLRWTADGKTSGEVSEIMNIAERTVNYYLNSTMVKLCAANKTAAAIKAVVLGLL